jgi:WD40 repeat protein
LKTLAFSGYVRALRKFCVVLWHRLAERALASPATLDNGRHEVAFTPDGKSLLTLGNDNMVRFWNPNTGVEERIFQGPERRHVSWASSA